jgi:lipid-binding SYLF domain-containing protein
MLHLINRFAGLLIIAWLLVGCAKKPDEAAIIDARADGALLVLNTTYPGAEALYENAAGTLIMPLISEFGFGLGGAFGRGVLRTGGATADYYNMVQGSYGLQAGGQRYSHVIFFMTQESLNAFRANGVMIGADAEYVIPINAYGLRADDVTSRSPVISVVFNESGLKAGLSLSGTKFNRYIP